MELQLTDVPRSPSLHTCRLLSAWSFQSKLGIISNTIILATPQLAHLLFVIFNAIALFALLSYLGLGQRVSYASSYAASFEETFRALLGLGYIKLPDVLPIDVALTPPQMLLSLIIYYGREVLFIMILMQFFMTTLGAQFMELKAKTLGSKASSIPQDVVQHVLPEVRHKAAAAFRRARQLLLHRQAVVPPSSTAAVATGDAGATPGGASAGSGPKDHGKGLSVSSEALLTLPLLPWSAGAAASAAATQGGIRHQHMAG